MKQIEALKKALEKSQRIVFFGGAGVSTESGIPDFRSGEGLYVKGRHDEVRPEECISHHFFVEEQAYFFNYYFKNLVYPDAEPNITHRYLHELEEAGKDVTVVTQNIDGLHQKAGSSQVIELHGTTLDYYCITCGQRYTLLDLQLDEQGIPRCEHDQGIVRPDIVLYEEALDPQALDGAIQAIAAADLLIVAGTSLVVYPAAGLVQYFQGEQLVVINKTPLALQAPAGSLTFQDSLGHVFKALKEKK